MKPSTRNILVCLPLLLALVGGVYWLGQSYSMVRKLAQARQKAGVANAPNFDRRTNSPSTDELYQFLKGENLSEYDKKGRFLELIGKMSPAELVKFIKEFKESSIADKSFLLIAFERLADRSPSQALALLELIDDPKIKRSVGLGAFQRLSAQDPLRALDALAKLPADPVNTDFYSLVFGALAKSNLPVALSAASNMPPGSEQDAAFQGLGRTYATSDPKAALLWAKKFSASAPALFQTVLTYAASGGGEPALAAQYVGDIQDENTRNATIIVIARAWGGADKDPASAMNWLNQTATGATYTQAVNSIITGLINPPPYGKMADPAAATALLGNINDPSVRATALNTIGQGWATHDPSAAMTWAQGLPAPDGSVALNAVMNTWSKNNPAAALAYLQNFPDPSVFLSSAPTIAQSLAHSDPEAALAFVQSLPNGSAQTQALSNILVGEIDGHLSLAWNYAANMPDGPNRDTVMKNLIAAEAPRSPADAASLIQQMPAGSAQLDATTSLAASWVKQDPQAFTLWLNTLTPSDVRDAAIVQLVSSTQAIKNTAGVLQWVNTVSNPQIKAALVQKLTQPQADSGN